MNKRLTAMLLVLALSLSVGMVSALADEETTPVEDAAVPQESLTVTVEKTETGGEDTQSGETVPVILVEPEEAPNTIHFADLQKLIKKNSPAYGAISANIGAIEEAQEQLETLEKEMVKNQRDLARVEASLSALEGSDDPDAVDMRERLQGQRAGLLLGQQQIQSGMSALAPLASQDTTQAEIGAKQFIMGCEAAYIALVDLKMQEASLERQLAALDRTLEALRIRKDGGQISELQLRQLESNRAALVSGMETMHMNVVSLRMRLEYMLGEEITGTTEVSLLPKVSAEELDAINPEEDLKLALRRNLSISAAKEARNNAEDSNPGGDLGEHLMDAADYGVENAELQAEMQYRALYAKLLDNRQALAAANAALEVAQAVYDAEAVKCERGTISKHALLDAEDTLLSAKDTVVKAEHTLFDTYNQYTWAVKYGVFSS